jgi:type VI secretion system secreted protein VgrG
MSQGGPYLNTILPVFFDHCRHKLQIDGLDTHLDVLAFEGHEYLSQPYLYRIEFTASDLDIGAEKFIGQYAEFSLYVAPPSQTDIGVTQPASHTDHRGQYAARAGITDQEGKTQ